MIGGSAYPHAFDRWQGGTDVPEAAVVVGGYHLVGDALNTGQNSQVFEAFKEGGHRRVAVKLLLKERKDREQLNYLRHEAEVAQGLEHPNIIKVLEYNNNRGSEYGPFFVMEFFPSPNLKTQIKRDPEMVLQRAHRIITQVAQALAYVHDKGWVHRDVKPDNILVNKNGEVRLIDFSLAVRIQGRLSRLFAAKGKKVQGTRSYMSPEQIRGQPLDPRSDIYSLGVAIFEMLAGRPPFRGNNPDELLMRHLRVPAPSISSQGVEVTPEFDNLLLRMLAKKREERPENLHSFLAEFRKIRILQKDPVQQEAMGMG
ncbi:MAG: serine/threonine protein kinase [Planctomycetes bacterium]|nr:serine/threonine protein kinase [Planctomycetota bacterium]